MNKPLWALISAGLITLGVLAFGVGDPQGAGHGPAALGAGQGVGVGPPAGGSTPCPSRKWLGVESGLSGRSKSGVSARSRTIGMTRTSSRLSGVTYAGRRFSMGTRDWAARRGLAIPGGGARTTTRACAVKRHEPSTSSPPALELPVEQLKGADYALRVLHTSPAIRGRALEILQGQMIEVVKDLESRSSKEEEARILVIPQPTN